VLTIPGNIGKSKKPSTIRDLTSGKVVRGIAVYYRAVR